MVCHRLTRRKRKKSERGQAALLAVVGLIVLAIGMYTSYNISRSVYEKIKLQNAADATAYSLATMEARTFNFIAFANRAQVANYVQMMEAQSLLSNTTNFVGVTGYAADFFLSFGRFLSNIPGLGAMAGVFIQIGTTFNMVHTPAAIMLDIMERTVPLYIRGQSAKNMMLTAFSSALALATLVQLVDGGSYIAAANDPKARLTTLSYVLNGLNTLSYVNAFDLDSFEPDDESKRIMSEMANASRFATGDPAFIVSRGFGSVFTQAMSGAGGELERDWGGGRRSITRLWKGRGSSMANSFMSQLGISVGTTKLLTPNRSSLPDLDETAQSSDLRSDLVIGDVLAAKDIVEMHPRLKENGFFSVRSGKDKSLHCTYRKPRDFGQGTLSRVYGLASLDNPGRFGLECLDENEDDHRWGFGGSMGGVTGYLKFAPGEGGITAQEHSFNQPDVWVYLNKRPEDMEKAGGDLSFQIQQGRSRHRASLDAHIGEGGPLQLGIGEGMNAMARAQVYYHRPGAWHEPPNFFNPYWGARLAPKNVAIKRLANELGLSGTGAQLIADNVWMH